MKHPTIFSIILLAYININAQAADFATGLNNPIGLSIKGNDLYVAESDDSKIIKVALQTPAEFVGTWELDHIIDSDHAPPLIASEVDPPISTPYLTINDDLTVSGKGTCNSFYGIAEIIIDEENITRIDFNITETKLTCSHINHITFEEIYFKFIKDSKFKISSDGSLNFAPYDGWPPWEIYLKKKQS